MGAAGISWRTTMTVIITASQIPALISVRTTAVTGVEGQTFNFTCEYPQSWQGNAKYLCREDDNDNHLIRTDRHNQWETNGRFSLYDNTTAAFFLVQVDRLVPEDGGTYWCGVDVSLQPDHISVIHLNVSRAAKSPNNRTHHINEVSTIQTDVKVDKLNMSLFLTAAMCVAAMLFVCLFTLCLLCAVKHQRSGPRQNRETSADYETMTPGEGTEPEPRCTCSPSDCAAPSAPPPPPRDLCPHFTSKHRESAVTLGEYAEVDVRGHVCQYQHLDLSQLEDHVYHRLCGPKDGPMQMNC
ncbi:CMRF35-like molecule 2 isoform X1 [Hippoglossus hippoglossus]|uniref:CMRF35-like molecule 2 isoform X1 n=1 Tax=Hippoglossus hippoglossus TaxID=8267 RepID=UPI00148B3ADC|nr:CMRF35-like molecule 2 isoform X1 [Hippoglossus hippoglossus]